MIIGSVASNKPLCHGLSRTTHVARSHNLP